MGKKSFRILIPMPGLISSIASGFNTAASNLYLILFPAFLDLFLWFGPHFRLKSILEPIVMGMIKQLSGINQAGMENVIQSTKMVWESILERLNLAIFLRTFPIGIPSLIAGIAPINTPLGQAPLYEMTGFGGVAGIWLFFLLLGIFLGTVYFIEIYQSSIHKEKTPFERRILRKYTQSIGLTLLLLLLVILLFIPGTIIISIITLISPFAAQIAMLILGFILLYLMFPFVFSPHGIISKNLNAVSSIVTSFQLVRFTLPATTLFILVLLLLDQGLNAIWRIPEEGSWMILVGIFGHAFISTALIASSFSYYRKGLDLLNAIRNPNATTQQT